MPFSDLGLSESSLIAIRRLGHTAPTEIQEKAIPVIISGRDVAARSPTGTGKTLAFVLGLIERVQLNWQSNYVLIMSPTRELAIQTRDAIQVLSIRGMKSCAVYGQVPFPELRNSSNFGFKFIVATPRKLRDLIERRRFMIERFNHIVLDEADELMRFGFREDIDFILARVKSLQTLLFSATLDQNVRSLSSTYQKNPERIYIGGEERPPSIVEETIRVRGIEGPDGKLTNLLRLLSEESGQVLVFVATKRTADRLNYDLNRAGVNSAAIHADFPQVVRERTLGAFRSGLLKVIVATDLLARGIDIPGLNLVVQFDQAFDRNADTHRSGRTGRMGNAGRVVRFVESRFSPRSFGGSRIHRSNGFGSNGSSINGGVDTAVALPRLIHPTLEPGVADLLAHVRRVETRGPANRTGGMHLEKRRTR